MSNQKVLETLEVGKMYRLKKGWDEIVPKRKGRVWQDRLQFPAGTQFEAVNGGLDHDKEFTGRFSTELGGSWCVYHKWVEEITESEQPKPASISYIETIPEQIIPAKTIFHLSPEMEACVQLFPGHEHAIRSFAERLFIELGPKNG